MQLETDPAPYLRHIRRCNNAVLPGTRTALRIGGELIGYAEPRIAQALRERPEFAAKADGGLDLREPAALERIVRDLAEAGLVRWRGEAFDVRARPDGPALARADRGALPRLGIEAVGVHVNGIVERPDGPWIWVGHRSAHKYLDPNKLDHLVAGGVPAGLSARETLEKEAAEEASVPAALARQAIHVGTIVYAMEREEGLRRDCLYCYDLTLPGEFQPVPHDDEVARFELMPLSQALQVVRETDDFKFNVALVVLHLGLRRGFFAPAAEAALWHALAPAGGPAVQDGPRGA